MSISENQQIFSDALHAFYAAGWKAIPVVVYQEIDKGEIKRRKKPCVNWKEYQKLSPSPAEIQNWVQNFGPYAGVELITGEYEPNCFVVGVDFDAPPTRKTPDLSDFADDLLGAFFTTTASGGFHSYFQHTDELSNNTNVFNKNKDTDTVVDIRGEGGVIVVGPSPLWSRDPRRPFNSTFDPPNTETPVILSRYVTRLVDIPRPNELLPLPHTFIAVAKKKSTASSLASPKTTATALSRLYEVASNPDKKVSGRHDFMLDIVSSTLATLRSPEEVPLIFTTLKRVFLAKFNVPGERPIEEGEVESIFSWCLASLKKRRTVSFLHAQPFFKAEEAQRKKKWQEDSANDIKSKWAAFDVTAIETIGDLSVFRRVDGSTFTLPSDKVISQPHIRSAFFSAANILLPTIADQTFCIVLSSIPKTKKQQSDIDPAALVELCLLETASSLEDSDSVDEALTNAKSKMFTKFNSTLYFRFATLVFAIKSDAPQLKQPQILLALEQLNARKETIGSVTIWSYGIT